MNRIAIMLYMLSQGVAFLLFLGTIIAIFDLIWIVSGY